VVLAVAIGLTEGVPDTAPLQPTRPMAAMPTRRPFRKRIVVTVPSLIMLSLAVMYWGARPSIGSSLGWLN
jgi:hypothetical protein